MLGEAGPINRITLRQYFDEWFEARQGDRLEIDLDHHRLGRESTTPLDSHICARIQPAKWFCQILQEQKLRSAFGLNLD